MPLRTHPHPHPAAAPPSPAPPHGVRPVAPYAIRIRLGVLALLTVASAALGAPTWTVLVAMLTCLAVPVAVAIQDGPAAARAMFPTRSRHRRCGPHRRR